MILLIACLLFLMIISQVFIFSINYNSINRAIIYTPREYFYLSIPPLLEDEEPYFNKGRLKSYLDDYYDKCIKDKARSYKYEIRFYNPIDDTFCIQDKCLGAEVKVDVNLSLLCSFTRKIFYEIQKN